LLFIYRKSLTPIINYTRIFYVGYNYVVNFKKFNYNVNTTWAENINPNFFYNYGGVRPYTLASFSGVFCEGTNLNFSKVTNSFNLFNQVLLTINFLFFGLYKRNFLQNIKSYNNILFTKKINKLNFFFNSFCYYETLFISLFKVKTHFQSTVKLKLSLNNNIFKLILQIITYATSIILITFFILYAIIIIFYNYSLFLPNFINFNLVNLTILFFIILNSNSIVDKGFIDFLVLLNKVNYNNLESSYGSLNFQEKYFLKYENTYFMDKKCSDDWVFNYYLPGEYFFKSRFINGFDNGLNKIN
jgi:hypothetical protein